MQSVESRYRVRTLSTGKETKKNNITDFFKFIIFLLYNQGYLTLFLPRLYGDATHKIFEIVLPVIKRLVCAG